MTTYTAWHIYTQDDESITLSSIRSGYCDEVSSLDDIAVAAHLHALATVFPGLSVAQAQSTDASLYKGRGSPRGLSGRPFNCRHENHEGQEGKKYQPHG